MCKCSYRLLGLSVVTIIVMIFAGATGDVVQAQSAQTLTVCSSGCDFAMIQAAVDAAAKGDVIEVQPGVYLENVTIFKKTELTLRGAQGDNGSSAPTIDGSSRKADRRPGILLQKSESVAIQGLQIALSDTGIWVVDSSVTISQAEIRENAFGMIIEGTAKVTIEESDISANTDRGVSLFSDAKAIIRKSTISANGSTGGISVSGDASLTLEENTITENVFVGVWVGENAQAAITKNTISNSRTDAQGASGHGVMLLGRAQVEISENEIQENAACGVSLFDDQGIELTGQDNTITDNGQNLCGPGGKFPTGFVGGGETL